ncbi:MAG: hypothetical protein JRI53_01520, partial [Deltaproteobacteria bacterium]|nr:hypothetical protein [Deltaproteobacteria bacterium]
MKKLLIYISLFFFLFSGALAQEQQKQSQIPDDKLHKEQFKLDGAWLPDHDPAEIGPSNFSDIVNLRYGANHPVGVLGYTEISTSIITTYTDIRNGHQLRTDGAQKSYVLVNSQDSSGNGRVFQNLAVVPAQGNFETAPIHIDAAGAGLGRFSDAPQGNVAYCNGKESYIYGGEEIRIGALFTVEEQLGSELIPAQENRDFSSPSNWENFNLTSWDETDDLSITASTSGLEGGISSTYVPMTTGHLYRIAFDAANIEDYWTFEEAYTYRIGSVNSNGAYSLPYLAQGTGGLSFKSGIFGAEGDFDNFSVKSIGYPFNNPIDYTEQANNSLDTAGNIIPIGTRKLWMIFTTRPVQGFNYTIKTVNTAGSQTLCAVWTGDAFTGVSNFDDGTKGVTSYSLGQSGSMTFDSTVSIAKPYHLEGIYLYAYLFILSDGSAEISHVSADAPWQPVVDVWDGVLRQPIQFQVESASQFEDYTLAVNYQSDIEIPIGGVLDGLLSTDNVVVMFSDRMAGIRFQMLAGLINENAADATVKYHTGSDWATVGASLIDETDNAGDTIGKTGLISWSPPDIEDEHPITLFGVTGYAYQFTFSATLSGTKGVPLTEDPEVLVDLVTGIPAQKVVKPFKFPSVYKNRVLLCAFTEGKEGNRVDYSSSNAPDVFNGFDSSMNGLQSLYFGNSDTLTAGTQLYNRYGSNVFAIWLALKETSTYILTGDTPEDFKVFPVSFTVGCPAPLTLATAEVGFEAVQGIQRNVAFWVSHSGPVMFDGSVLFPIPGVDKYFDPAESVCVNFEYLENARGWYDTTYREYNILLPSGSSQVANNLWLAYDIVKKKWFKKYTGVAETPQAAFQVADGEGNKYVYAGIDTGYMMRLEYGDSFGSTMLYSFTTGDFLPSKNIWDKTLLRQIKIITRANSEDTLDVYNYQDTANTS